MLGFQEYTIEQLLNNISQITVSAQQNYVTAKLLDKSMFSKNTLVKWTVPPSGLRNTAHIEYPNGWYQRLSKDPRVVAYSPQMDVNAVIRHDKSTQSATIIGVNAAQQMKVTTIEQYMMKGSFKQLLQGGSRIVLGDGLFKKLGTIINGTVFVSNSNGQIYPYKVVGVFKFGIKAIDDTTAYTSLAGAQTINQTPGEVTTIAIRVKNVAQAHAIAAQWAAISHDKVESWDQTNANILSVFTTQNIIRYFMTISILIVAGFGIYNVLNVLINQKKREIAILRAMGYTSRDIMYLFLIQGLLLGIMGGLLGLLVGYLSCLYLQTLPLIGGEIGLGSHMLVSFDRSIYINGFLLAFLSAIISSILPSYAAGKLTPIGIIQSETS